MALRSSRSGSRDLRVSVSCPEASTAMTVSGRGSALPATTWFGGCAGCHMSLLDVDEFLAEFAGPEIDVRSANPTLDLRGDPRARPPSPLRDEAGDRRRVDD